MDKFLKDYIIMIAYSMEKDLTQNQINEIISKVKSNDEFWDFLDNIIMSEIGGQNYGKLYNL